MAIPQFINQSPSRNFIGAVITSPVYFEAYDADGLNQSTLQALINTVPAIVNGIFQTGFSGSLTPSDSGRKLAVVITRIVAFSYSQTVNVAVEIDDNLSNHANDYWHFVTVPNPDHTPPFVVANPHGAVFNVAQAVTLTASEANVTIYYTVDGTRPDLSSPVYSVPISIATEGTTTLKFIGIDSGNNSDIERTEIYVIDTIPPTTHSDPAGGNYFSSQTVQLICDDPFATIYYTINGTNPTINSAVYSTPIVIPDDKVTKVKFFAVDRAGNIETIRTSIFTISIAKNNFIPRNVFVTCPYITDLLDIRWEDMYPSNTNIIGYNVYRADVEFGLYQKLNKALILDNQYQDKTLDVQIINEDVSDQFRRTINISSEVNDEFLKKDIDVTKWKESDPSELMFQYNGLLFVDKAGVTRESKLTSRFKLKGDFDVQVDYDLLNWSQPNGPIESSIFRVKYDDNNYVQISRDRSQTVSVYNSNRFINGNPDLPITASTSDLNGTYRITRVGNVISTYFFNAGNFILVQSFNSYTEDLYIEVVGKSADVPIELRWTNFKVNSGNPVIIEPLTQLKEMFVKTSKEPIVDSSGLNTPTDDISEVSVTVNGQYATIKKLFGKEGLVQLENEKKYDEVLKIYVQPIVPDEHSTVLVNYKTPIHTTKTKLRKKYFYKVTIVTNEDETDLDVLTPETLKPEKLSYIYEEAIRRNSWLLDQGGERVLLYIKRKVGQPCPCILRDVKRRTHRRADQDCEICYGSGFVGGFYGPIPVIIANMIGEQRIQQTERGLHLGYQVETWMGPSPLLSQRDMIIRRNCDRCLIGPITPVEGPGGIIVQQHFTIEILDTTDIRYKFPVQPLPHQFIQPGIDKPGTQVPEINSPKEREALITDKGVDRVKRGRSITFQEINY
jgi:hypothetical protein